MRQEIGVVLKKLRFGSQFAPHNSSMVVYYQEYISIVAESLKIRSGLYSSETKH